MSVSTEETRQVDRIYEAALVPELWPQVFDEIARSAGMMGGGLAALPYYVLPLQPKIVPKIRWTASPRVSELFHAFFTEGWATRCPLTQGGRALQRPFFIGDDDIFGPGGFQRTPIFEAFYRRYDVGGAAGLFMNLPSGDLLTFSFERHYADGPVARETITALESLRPHLARAALISARLGLERAKAAAQALSLLGLPAAVLSPVGHLLHMNDEMADLQSSTICHGAYGKFRLRDKRADTLLSTALSDATMALTPTKIFSLPVAQTEQRPAAVVHLIPIRGNARDLFSAASSILVITPMTSIDPPSADILKGLFDLTEAEARVARLIASGETVSSAATKSGTTEETVRGQLKKVFSKVGVSRQAELVGLLGARTFGMAKDRIL